MLNGANQVFELPVFVVFEKGTAFLLCADGQHRNVCITVVQQKKYGCIDVIGTDQADKNEVGIYDF